MVYRITGIIRGRKVSRITLFTVVRQKTFAIQAISYIKIPAEIKVQENIHECFQIHEIRELFLPQTIPVIRYMAILILLFSVKPPCHRTFPYGGNN